jgi:hypothetical protein
MQISDSEVALIVPGPETERLCTVLIMDCESATSGSIIITVRQM